MFSFEIGDAAIHHYLFRVVLLSTLLAHQVLVLGMGMVLGFMLEFEFKRRHAKDNLPHAFSALEVPQSARRIFKGKDASHVGRRNLQHGRNSSSALTLTAAIVPVPVPLPRRKAGEQFVELAVEARGAVREEDKVEA